MSMSELLLADEGAISRRQWWTGTLLLGVGQLLAGWMATRWLGRFDRPAMLFLSLAALIPFHAVNAKRFRAIGRDPALALWGGGVVGSSVLSGAFVKLPILDIALGLGLIAIVLWHVVDLGVLDHEAKASPARIDAAARRP